MNNKKKSNALLDSRMQHILLEHLQALMNSLGQLSRSMAATLLTVGVIGIALALPLGLSVFLHNIQAVSGNLHGTSQISLYLDDTVGNQQATQMLHSIQMDQSVKQATYISPEQGLADFSASANFGDVLKDLKNNPLPGVVTVIPSDNLSSAQVNQLVDRLQRLPGVQQAQLDMKWLQRLQAIIDIGHRAAVLLMILFSFAVLLIIGNTIRLTTQNHYDEILIIKLIGGTDDFIRRPFLYSGALYGLAGAIIAWFLVDFSIWCLQNPISKLTGLYGSNYQVIDLSLGSTFLLIVGAILLGLLASWLAVNQFIHKVEPK